ncbi:hypothetical protein RYO59_001571 [Thermosynechococcaceae cyanobacterium Okahandja]
MDDAELFAAFIADALKGATSLVSNANYRVESAFGTLQLVDNKAGVMATAKQQEGGLQIIVKRYSEAWEPLRQALIAASFFPDLAENKSQLVAFRAVEIPAGLQLYDCAASDMWRSWRRQAVDQVLVYTAGAWRATGEMSCSGGVVFIPIPDLNTEVQITSSTLMSWLAVPVT